MSFSQASSIRSSEDQEDVENDQSEFNGENNQDLSFDEDEGWKSYFE